MAKRRPAYDLGPRVTREATTRPYSVLREQHRALSGLDGQRPPEPSRPVAPQPPPQPPIAAESAAGVPLRLPPFRKLRVYTQDPATPRMLEPEVELDVPYEPLEEGPSGAILAVHDENETTGEVYEPVRLDDHALTLTSGLRPSTTDPRFAQQMTYALCSVTYDRFRKALGREPQFGFDPHPDDAATGRIRLRIYPHGVEEDNAFYDPDRKALVFGYTRANKHAQALSQQGSVIFTSLSHDVVVHEMTHALLDGMRARFMLPTHADVDGFHEGFADLVALFQRFSYRKLVTRALAASNGEVTSRVLVDLARQWGAATSDGETALRTAFLTAGDLDKPVPVEERYRPTLEAHDMGAVLMRAVFDAFRFLYDLKTASLRRLAPPTAGRLAEPLVELLAGAAARLADQFVNILIRAVDYCPPVDLRLGEYLRALVTADYDLVPDDEWGYREALVRGFRRHGITVEGVLDLTEDALLWRGPERHLTPLRLLSSDVRHKREADRCVFTRRPDHHTRIIRAHILGRYATLPENLYYFGLAAPSQAERIERPVVESFRGLRRVSLDGTVISDFVAEIVQRRRVGGRWLYGGATVILNTSGEIRYIIAKNVKSRRRERSLREYLDGIAPREYRALLEDEESSAARLRLLHGRARTRRVGRDGTQA